ncbi:MAG TPA: glycosyltransferase family 39 protein [Nitrososphaeraceae archaeon]|nr:glycosyltransferase family 39 protein [Nitrososphaeraceae archaeon]
MYSYIKKNLSRLSFLSIVAPLLLSGLAHLWNPIGFPHGPVNDEGIYLRRAMNVVEGHGPQELSPLYYDHPYFLQLFLASVFGMVGYPDSFAFAGGDVYYIETLYLVPRVLTGILAVTDTFLIYKIAARRYNSTRIALLASILFAVMPITFPIRWVLLESVQLPFLLLSILLATRKRGNGRPVHYIKLEVSYSTIITLTSGIFLGLSIFTKIPAFIMIPFVAFLVYTNNNNNNSNKERWKLLGLWIIPVVAIPLIWPVYVTFSLGQFDEWWTGINLQTHRTNNNTFFDSVNYNFKIDPAFVILGIISLVFVALIKKDTFILLWVMPFVVFLNAIRFVSFYHLIPIVPALCIAASVLIMNLSDKIVKHKIKQKMIAASLPIIAISAVAVFGFANMIMMIAMSNNSPYFEALSFLVQYLKDVGKNDNEDGQRVSVISNPFYLWIPKYVFNLDNDYIGYYDSKMPIKNNKILAVMDQGFIDRMKNNQAGKQIQDINKYSSHTMSMIAALDGSAQQHSRREYVYIYEYKIDNR